MTKRIRRTIRNLTDLLTKEQTEILKTAGLLMVPALLTKLTGQIYQVLVATQLGTSVSIDQFNLAETIPEAILNILLLGVVGVVVIPIFIEAKEKEGEKRFLHIYNSIVNFALVSFIAVTIVLILFAHELFPVLVHRLGASATWDRLTPSQIDEVISMMQFLMIPNLILAISVLLSSALNVYQRFIVPHLAPLFYNLGRVLAVFVLLPLMNKSPWALVLGILMGSILHLAVQWPLGRMLNIYYIPVFDITDKYVRRIFRIAIPRGIAFATEVVSITILRLLAAGLGLGAISVFDYANSLALVIPTLFGSSFAIASFPTMSKLYSKGNMQELSTIVVRTVNQIFFLSLPFIITLIILRLPAVRLVYGLLPNTAFDREATLMVAWTVLFLAIGVMFVGAKWFLYRLFYVANNTVTPMLISIASLIVTVILAVLLSNLFSHQPSFALRDVDLRIDNLWTFGGGKAAVGGLALAFSIANILEFIVLLILVHYKVVPINISALLIGFSKKLMPAGVMTVLMYFMYRTWDTLTFPIDAHPEFTGSTTINLVILTSITVATCFMVYYLLCYIFQVEELKVLRIFLNPLFKLAGVEIK